MVFTRIRIVIIGVALLLPACGFTEDTLWPSLTGEDPAGTKAQKTSQPAAEPQKPAAQQQVAGQPGPAQSPEVQRAPPVITSSPQPPLGTTNFEPSGVTPGTATGTFVGKKVEELRGELGKLQKSI